jgi:hypothetical protein
MSRAREGGREPNRSLFFANNSNSKTLILNSSISKAFADIIIMQDRLFRIMNQRSAIEIPIDKVVFWHKKFHDMLFSMDALNEAAAQDLGLENIYSRPAVISAIKQQLEAAQSFLGSKNKE